MTLHRIESVAKALQILTLFGIDKPKWRVTEIARELGMQKSTVHRLLATMQEYGFVRKDTEGAHYSLGLRIFELGSLVFSTLDLRNIAVSYLHKLSNQCGETVHIGVLNEVEVMSIESVETQSGLKSTIIVGKRAPLYCTGVGKALLAFLPADERNKIIDRLQFQKFTANTIIDKEVLTKELDDIRSRGYAVDNMEHEVGVRCIAAPIWDRTGKVVASLSVSGPSIRITEERIPELARLVVSTTKDISAELGAHGV
ncbi:MAG: IclR family transcriptional regulator [Firmicutes bacterium]|nr:IclR family transcriptional regulator [Bacillota bacterium]